jgi:hypothetical protein
MLLSQHQMRMETKIRHAMACRIFLYEDRAQYIVPLHFIIFGRGLIYHTRGFSG